MNTVPAWMLDFDPLQIIVNINNVKITGVIYVWFIYFFKTMKPRVLQKEKQIRQQ